MQAYVLERNTEPAKAFVLRELPDPAPGPGEVRIAVEASGLNFADVLMRRGIYDNCPPLPLIIGYEAVGRVDAVGEGVELDIGTRVTAFTHFGGYADRVISRADAVASVPEDMPAAAAAALATQYCTAWYCAEIAISMHAGDLVLVHAAAGGVGSALVQLALRRGCEVIGTAGSDEKVEHLRRQGVHHPINYATAPFHQQLGTLLPGRRLDVVFDPLGGADHRRARRLLAPLGRLVSYGATGRRSGWRRLYGDPGLYLGFGWLNPLGLLVEGQTLVGVEMLLLAEHKPAVLAQCLRSVVALAVAGELQPHVGRTFATAELALAHDYMESRASIGKSVLAWTPPLSEVRP